MSGHQAAVWHAGIAAKWFAVTAATRDGAAAWVIADQDANDARAWAFPDRDASGWLRRRSVAVVKAARYPEQTPTGSQAASAPVAAAFEELGASMRRALGAAEVDAGWGRIERLLAEHAGAASLAEQVHAACAAALGEVEPMPVIAVRASQLGRTTLLAELVRRMAAEPERCVAAYNAAAQEHPAARLRPLMMLPRSKRFELPLWRLAAGEPRRPVFSHEVGALDPATLAPRALLLTGLMRLGACDLFIHGLGGEVYDPASERWLRSWLGDDAGEPASSVTASATLRLPFADAAIDPARASDALALPHRALTNPGLLGDAARQATKRTLLAAIDDARSRRDRRSAALLFQQLKGVEREALKGEAAAAVIAQLGRQADEARSRAAQRPVVLERAWPWPLHSRGALEDLRHRIRAAFGA